MCLLYTDLMNSHIKFLKRQTNEVDYSLTRASLLKASFHIYFKISTYIKHVIINKIH